MDSYQEWLKGVERDLKWFFACPSGVCILVVLALLVLGLFQHFWPDSWWSDLPIKSTFASVEATSESGVSYYDDGNGLVYISYANPAQKYQAIQKWHADFPDRWNRQIWADAENGVLMITYVP